MTSRAAISAQQQIGIPPKTHRFRVLGVDPAVAGATGYGIVEFRVDGAHMLGFGALGPAEPHSTRGSAIHQLIAPGGRVFRPTLLPWNPYSG
jgi:hypothetical protein